jgi:LPXTG-motif cell wall-anchored protein
MRTPIRTLAVMTAIAASMTILPGAASAGRATSITVTPTSAEVGANFTVSGFVWLCGVDVGVTAIPSVGQPVALGTIAASEIVGGEWSATYAAPSPAGVWTIRAEYLGECSDFATAELTVTQTTTTTTTLAPTTTTTTTTTTLAPTTTQAVTTTSLAIAPVLPVTGDASDATAWAAIALLLGGAGLVWLARRPTRA